MANAQGVSLFNDPTWWGTGAEANTSLGNGVSLGADSGGSMWDGVSNFMGDYGDVLASLTGKYAQYEKNKADNNAQNIINQAAAKWSGFQPSLMSMVKPIESQNPVAMAMEAVSTAPKYWYDMEQMYNARKAAKAGDASKMEELQKREQNQKTIDSGLNTWRAR